MSKFRCKCLNVTIHVKEKATREAEGTAFVSENCSEPFFTKELYEVELAVGGITKEVGNLVRETQAEDWDVVTCTNCNMDTHALHTVKKYDRVLINREMESDPVVHNKCASSSEYSSIFKLILKPAKENDPDVVDNSFAGNAILLGQDKISVAMVSVQEQVKKFLQAEEDAMNERIRKFVAEQKRAFTALQAQVSRDKKALYCAIKREEEKAMESSLDEAMVDTSFDTPVPFKAVATTPGWNDHPPAQVNKVHITQVAPHKYPLHPGAHPSHKTKRHKSRQKSLLQSDTDPVFTLDDFTDDCEPFFESEEDDFSSSDNSFQSEEPIHNPGLKNVKKSTQYSSSLPISMPAGKISPPMDDQEFAIPEPSKIGESMKALARSVHDTSEKLFGELPRPRRSTYSHR